jgi:phenylalanyl-tRNA synthetase beta chain
VSSADERELAAGDADAPDPVRVLNPIAAPLDVMRTTLLPGLLGTLASNLRRREARVRLFEVGRVFRRGADGIDQPLRVGGIAAGGALPEQWGSPARPVDLFDVKGDLEALLHPARLATVARPHAGLHPGRSATLVVDDRPVGWLGELHPRLVRRYELGRPAVAFELDLEACLARRVPVGRAVSRQPVVRRDLALLVDEAVPVGALVDALVAGRPPVVEAIRPFDVFRGGQVAAGRKSVAILVLMQDTARTLTDAEIDAAVEALATIARSEFGATLRSQDPR